ncbi:MAG: electron transfer flavoprotein subunit alpha/FixB family protein [Fervidicoccaceae archaeon]|nr:electron transfer flavoprotein subunit alpha/FixB family protein [Fervidicoccaceae archaeon]
MSISPSKAGTGGNMDVEIREGIMVIADIENGTLHRSTLELLGKARELADSRKTSVSVALAGNNVGELKQVLFEHGADRVYIMDCEELGTFDPATYKEAYISIIKEAKPEVILISATHRGRSIAPRIAAHLATGLTADCTDLYFDEKGNFIQVRPAYAGNIYAHILSRTKPAMSTVRPGVFKPIQRIPGRTGEAVVMPKTLCPRGALRTISKTHREIASITEAKVIITVGRGLRRKEDIELVKKLARIIGASVGATRPLVDMGWMPKENQVGYSGNIVKPRIYIGLGVSGSPMHVIGMKDSEIIVSVNRDPNAPIVNISDYAIIGDLYEFIEKLTKEVERLKSKIS